MAFLLVMYAAGWSHAEPELVRSDQVVRLGISSRTFPATNRNDALAAMRVWVDTVIKERELRESVEVALYDSVEELRSAYEQGRVDAVSLTTEEIMLLGVRPDYVYIPNQDHGFHVRYVLLVRRDGAVADVADLTGHELVVADHQRMVFAGFWLESLLADVDGNRTGRRLVDQARVAKPSKAILRVFFQQAQAALVTLEAFELACELNPQLRDELKVLRESPPLVTALFLFRPDWHGVTRERLEEAVLNLHATPGGQQVLTVFQSSRMEKQPGSVLDSTRSFLERYLGFAPDPPPGEEPS
ncbi:PhnD/SsuA/transferrin family substrate-binding protein [Desulfonatronum sp. SC1]|uniref:PhnD/SsuA/transferrin family substrate-binding protein n=1 Tax=Desulfonatronum sp. SC1 TaxID=2109626 RepID=UPI001304E7AD|nr:PhnD/SsuA/transferrin family substrate-binding protein [Desulfonatronum sp. SC1]